MKKLILCLSMLLILSLWLSLSCRATDVDAFDDEIEQIENSVDGDTAQALEDLGVSNVDDVIDGGIDSSDVWKYLYEIMTESLSGPLSALVVLTAAILLTSVAESYAYSLRYTETRDIMGAAVSLFTVSVVITPITELVSSCVMVIQGSSALMTVYLPVMAGMMAFSGHAITSGGYYAAVVTAAGVISRLASSVMTPLLDMILSLSVCAGLCSRVRIGGFIETLSKGFKYSITFAMSVFIAILGLNSALSGAADTVANKSVKFGLSSFIPLIGSSISEAYGALQSSLGTLRSGVGVFVILAVFASFAPVLIRSVLWSAALSTAKAVSELLSVSSALSVMNILIQFVSALRTVLIAVMTVFIISSSVMIRLGGSL